MFEESELERLFERYSAFEVIGSGGFGVVCKVHDNNLNKKVAMKMTIKRAANEKMLVQEYKIL